MWGCGRNEQKIASASDDWTVGLWDASSSNSLCKLTHHTAPVYGIAWSPDGSCIASSSFDRSVILWDVRARKIVSLQRIVKACLLG
jgi:WD40 repeat protein